MDRENFYILLEFSVTPPENDINKINAAINKKQAEWSTQRNHPSKGRQAQHYLDLLPEIKKIMTDENLRREEAEQAKKIVAQKEKEKYKELDEAIQLLSTKKSISEEEIDKLTQKFSIPGDEIRKRIKVPIVKSTNKKKTSQRLEPAIEKKISDTLAIIGKKSLYHFLDLTPTSSLNTLITKTNEIAAEIKKDARKDAILTASLELTGHCLNAFKTEEMRKMYDATLAYQGLEELNKAIEIAGMDNRIDVEEFDSLMTKARQLGLKLDEAEEHIIDYCTRKKWVVRTPTKPTVEEMKQCGNCGLMNTPGSKNCADCGSPLEVACPNCKHISAITHAGCIKCGFPIGDMPNALPLLKEAKAAKADGDVKKAAQLLNKALSFWPNHPEAMALLQEIKARETEIAQLTQQLDDLVTQRKYYSARPLLFKLKHMDATHPLMALESRVNDKIAAAESWVKKAQTAAKGDDGLDCFNQALLECKDCPEAIEGIAKYPPEPPQRLKVLPTSRSISLQWEKSSSRGSITYLMVRKALTPPLNALDGENLGETAQTLTDETTSVPGVIYYYGVYAKRGEVPSTTGAIAGPVMRTAEIESLTVTPGDALINLIWKAPTNAREIVVRIKVGGIPRDPNDGQPLQGVRQDGVVATRLTNNQSYGFLILAVFKDEHGRGVFSSGTTCQSQPVAPPDPVTDISAVKKGNRIHIAWTPPARGTVQILHSRQPFHFSGGEILPAAKLSAIGTQIPVQHAGNVQIPANFQGILHILPITVIGDIAVVGKAVLATSIDEISHLKGTVNSGKLYLEWQWPAGAQKVLIAYNHLGFVTGPDDANAQKRIVSQLEYLRNSAFIIGAVEPKDYYLTVFVVAGEGEESLYSTGVQCLVANTGVVELYYEIQLLKNFVGKVKSAHLKLFGKNNNFKMPKAILIKKNHNLPLRKTDGVPIMEIGPLDVGKNPISIEIPAKETGKDIYVKLFFKEDDQNRKYRVMSPSKDKLLLG